MICRWCLVVHVLRMAGIDNCDGVTINKVGIIPFIGVGHIIAFPSFDNRLTARQRSFYRINVEDGIANVAFHIFIRIGVTVLSGDISVECPDFLDSPLGINVLILHP